MDFILHRTGAVLITSEQTIRAHPPTVLPLQLRSPALSPQAPFQPVQDANLTSAEFIHRLSPEALLRKKVAPLTCSLTESPQEGRDPWLSRHFPQEDIGTLPQNLLLATHLVSHCEPDTLTFSADDKHLTGHQQIFIEHLLEAWVMDSIN